MTMWFLALLSRDTLMRRGLRLTSNYRDLISTSEVLSAVDLGLALAVTKYDHTRGPFLRFASLFTSRVLMKLVRRELTWRHRVTELTSEEQAVSPDQASSGAMQGELRHVLGPDFDTFMEHHAWGTSLRELGRREGRSFRSVRAAVGRANRRILAVYDYHLGAPSKGRTSARQMHARLRRRNRQARLG